MGGSGKLRFSPLAGGTRRASTTIFRAFAASHEADIREARSFDNIVDVPDDPCYDHCHN